MDARRRAGPRDGAARTPVLQQVRLPGVQLFAQRAGAAAVLLQLARRRLPQLRRAGPGDGVRRAARGRLPVLEPGLGRGEGLGPAQCLHLLDAGKRGQALRLRHRHALRSAAGKARSRCCCTARAKRTSPSSTRRKGAKGRARSVKRSHPFEGILPNLERRFRETDSAAVREDLARYQAAKPCPDCGGSRLRREARNVFLQQGDATAAGRADLPRRAQDAGRMPGLLRRPAAARRQGRDRRQDRARDPLAAEVPERRGPELPEPGPQRRHAVGRRGAAHPPGQPDRQRADRRDVRAGRAQHRPAPARQRAPDRHAEAAARPGQLGAGGGARRGHDPAPPTMWWTWARAPACTAGGSIAQGTPADIAAQRRLADRPVPVARAAHRAAACARARWPGRPTPRRAAHRQRARQQPEERRRRDPGGPVHLRHRRVGLGQEHAGQRHAVRRGGAQALRQPRRAGAARRDRRARTPSTR